MKNYELFSPECPDQRVKDLVFSYALHNVLDNDRRYTDEKLLDAQHRLYREWFATMRKTRPGFVCCFYEWMTRDADSALIFSPGDLVKYNGHYCVVAERLTRNVEWGIKWRVTGAIPMKEDWPKAMTALNVREANGRLRYVDGLDIHLEQADIPPEVFALACGKANDCPMLKGGHDVK